MLLSMYQLLASVYSLLIPAFDQGGVCLWIAQLVNALFVQWSIALRDCRSNG